ncbi:LCP family protein [Microlunatus sp. Gsoil 973]|jgi:LCP family protein required for cell wall assembly|uniref:LCP family protein n=1 Tax=Microlunatus sp. Gsoil 973 TaxID=2672569 RepID=UPI0018A80BA1|nr:LCP family protein [Microlunatus sp. Gsoil 973]
MSGSGGISQSLIADARSGRPRSIITHRMPRRSLLALLAAAPAAVVTACTGKTPSGPSPTVPTATAAATDQASAGPKPANPTASAGKVTVTTKGLTGGLAELATALYSGNDVRTTAATAILEQRRRPNTDEVVVTGSAGRWRGTPVGVLAHGDDLTFAVQRREGWTVVAGRWPSLGLHALSAGDRQFALIIGSDAREKQGESITRSRGDTLHVCGVDGRGGAAIVGIPRDSWIDGEKINAAMVFGGPAGQTAAVAKLTGLPVDHYVVTGFLGFQRLVRAIGGVTVDSPGIPGRGIPKGVVRLKPEKALQFARERHMLPNGDFGRSANQQRLLAGLVLAMKTLGPTRFGSLVNAASRLTETNLPAENALQYAAWAWTIRPSKVGRAVATGGFGWRGSQSVVLLGSHAQTIFKDFADGNLSHS